MHVFVFGGDGAAIAATVGEHGAKAVLATGDLQGGLAGPAVASAIVGAVRADYFAGSGAQAGEWAGRFKQGLRLWVLWECQKIGDRE